MWSCGPVYIFVEEPEVDWNVTPKRVIVPYGQLGKMIFGDPE
jgi:hypothetical protein